MERRLALTRHPNGQWCRKIGGRLRYFGKNYEEALRRWYQETRLETTTLHDIAKRWIEWKATLDLSPRTLEGYRWMAARVEQWNLAQGSSDDLDPLDVERFLSTLGGVWRRRNALTMLKGMIVWGEGMGLCGRPRGMGLWKGPAERELRKSRRGAASLWTVEEVIALVSSGSVRGRFMAALGINLGFGMSDMATPMRCDGEFLGGPRPKTGVQRLGWLWPETRSLWDQCGGLPIGNPRSGHLFRQWRRHTMACRVQSNGRRHYDLRATLRTWLSEWGDLEASRLVMGHETPGVERFYLRNIAKERVRDVLISVRDSIGLNRVE